LLYWYFSPILTNISMSVWVFFFFLHLT
jgi:hypothetical protein